MWHNPFGSTICFATSSRQVSSQLRSLVPCSTQHRASQKCFAEIQATCSGCRDSAWFEVQVNYDEKNAKDGNDSEYSGHSNAEDESADEVQDADKPANKVGNMSQA